jgi:hypothetical protein
LVDNKPAPITDHNRITIPMRILIALLLSTVCALAQKATVNFAAGPGQRDVVTSALSPVTVGTVSIGFFDNGGNWNQFGSTDIREIFGEPGRFAGTASSDDPLFQGEIIFLSIEADGMRGLYTSSEYSWEFPDPLALPPENTTSIHTSQIDTAIYGSFSDTHLVLVPEPLVTRFAIVAGILALGLYFLGGNKR